MYWPWGPIQLSLDLGWHIDAVSSGPGAGQGSSGFGQVGERVVALALKQLDLNHEVFIIKLLQLFSGDSLLVCCPLNALQA